MAKLVLVAYLNYTSLKYFSRWQGIIMYFLSWNKVTEEVFEDLKARFMEVYDDNKDGKIDIREMAQLLPMEENFLLLFRFDHPLDSSVEFMKVWNHNLI